MSINTGFASEYKIELDVETNDSEYNLVLTGFNKMGKAVKLESPYSYVKDIELTYLDYFFSFEFSVLDFVSPNKNLYSYRDISCLCCLLFPPSLFIHRKK